MMVPRFLLAAAIGCLVSLPAVAQLSNSDLAKQVTIRRTQYGVPHIFAPNERAAGFGMGYAQAEDHALNIMRRILTARGEQAKYFGDVDNNVKLDFWNRQYRVFDRAVETYHLLDADWRDMTEGFAAGFSYYVQLHRADLPDWVSSVSGHDVAAHGLTGVARFAFNRRKIVDRLIEKIEGGETAVVESDEDMGSNVWAFAPERTTSGNAILMGNPHQPWSPVATYYEVHITIPGKYNFYGSTFVGRPVMTTGFNEYLGWSHTVNYPDLEEIYALDIDPNRADHYLFDGGSVPLTSQVAEVEIKIDSGSRVERKTFWYSPLGPVVYRSADTAYVLRSVAYPEYRFYQQWYRLGQSKNFEEFRAVLNTMRIPMFNIGYADNAGNIYYLWNGTVPDIPHAAQQDVAVHASNSSQIWTKVHPISSLPQLKNPTGGYIMNSNSPPYFTNLYEPMARSDYPAHFPNNGLSLRSQHSLELIHNDRKFSLEDVVREKFSMRMLLADRVKEDLIAAIQARGPEGELLQAAGLLEAWDNSVSKSSRGSTLFEAWWERYAKDHTPAENYETVWDETAPMTTPRGLADAARAVDAFIEAMQDVEEDHGTWDVAWGDVHRMRFEGVDIPVGGASGALGTFRVVSYKEADDHKRVAYGGDSWVFAVEFGDSPTAYSVVAYSQSENVGSPHYADQAPLYANNQMKRVAFTEEEIRARLLASYHPGDERDDTHAGG